MYLDISLALLTMQTTDTTAQLLYRSNPYADASGSTKQRAMIGLSVNLHVPFCMQQPYNLVPFYLTKSGNFHLKITI